jgi:hypothetical protein
MVGLAVCLIFDMGQILPISLHYLAQGEGGIAFPPLDLDKLYCTWPPVTGTDSML